MGGRLNEQGVFVADQVLAKHDENYMPPEVAEALERSSKGGQHKSADVEKAAETTAY